MKKVYILWSKRNDCGLSASRTLETPQITLDSIEEKYRKDYCILEATITQEIK